LENNDEDHKLRFWEYAEDFKLNHPDSYRFEDQVQRSGGRVWPSDYRCTKSESKKLAQFIYQTFVADAAPCLVSSTLSPEVRRAIQSQLSAAPRSIFVALQAAVMQELVELFHVDFSRSAKYRASFLSASMDKQGCREVGRVAGKRFRRRLWELMCIAWPCVFFSLLSDARRSREFRRLVNIAGVVETGGPPRRVRRAWRHS
jgi:hypothetical protein